MNPYNAPERLAKLSIEVTTQCNLKCAGCRRTAAIESGVWSDLHMTSETFSNVLEHLPPTGTLVLHGVGEPTLHPELTKLVEMAKASGKFGFIRFTTNALARDVEYYCNLIKAGLDEIWISVDSLDQDVADAVRQGTNVHKLKKRIKDLIDAGVPIMISMVVSAKNLLDIPDTLWELHKLGNPKIWMQEYQEQGDSFGVLSPEHRKRFLKLINALVVIKPTFRLHLPNFTQATKGICSAPWARPAINVQGYLTPCCNTFNSSEFGNINLGETSFRDAWKQPSVLGWVKRFLDNKVEVCQGCKLNPQNFGTLNDAGKSAVSNEYRGLRGPLKIG
ncbi:MAG: radical SAM protein [Betaproteobacteria bacterium]|nr:radical SAM protein [Betaproteobacteria bacterium]